MVSMVRLMVPRHIQFSKNPLRFLVTRNIIHHCIHHKPPPKMAMGHHRPVCRRWQLSLTEISGAQTIIFQVQVLKKISSVPNIGSSVINKWHKSK